MSVRLPKYSHMELHGSRVIVDQHSNLIHMTTEEAVDLLNNYHALLEIAGDVLSDKEQAPNGKWIIGGSTISELDKRFYKLAPKPFSRLESELREAAERMAEVLESKGPSGAAKDYRLAQEAIKESIW